MSYKIEQNVPIPTTRVYNKRSRTVYPFATMYPRESFFVKATDNNRGSITSQLRSRATRISQTTGKSYTVRQVENGVRVWRNW